MPRPARHLRPVSSSGRPRPAARIRAHAALLGTLAIASGCYQDPQVQLDEAQAQLDLTATLEDLGSRSADLQFQLDSLRAVVARQDTTIARLANLAGVPYPR